MPPLAPATRPAGFADGWPASADYHTLRASLEDLAGTGSNDLLAGDYDQLPACVVTTAAAP
jgi:hypothetical protein